jgi:RsiW-degrading membrane proteinase PrsW (M82 family)
MDWREYIPLEEGLAVVLAIVTIVMPLTAYLYYPDLFGEYRTLKVLVIAALGGGASFSLYVGPSERLLALVPGLVAGLGAAALYVACAGGGLPMEHWILKYAALGIGATPGFLLLWLCRRVAYRRNHP